MKISSQAAENDTDHITVSRVWGHNAVTTLPLPIFTLQHYLLPLNINTFDTYICLCEDRISVIKSSFFVVSIAFWEMRASDITAQTWDFL